MKSMYPNLMVYNVNDTIEYYKAFLGFQLLRTIPPEGNFQWAMMKCGEVRIMFRTRERLSADIPQFVDAEPGSGFTLFIIVSDVSKLYEKIKDNVEVVSDLQETFYGMNEFSIRDLNGYVLTFAEPISQ
ncbi:MAG: VOC family protein [bacterium]